MYDAPPVRPDRAQHRAGGGRPATMPALARTGPHRAVRPATAPASPGQPAVRRRAGVLRSRPMAGARGAGIIVVPAFLLVLLTIVVVVALM